MGKLKKKIRSSLQGISFLSTQKMAGQLSRVYLKCSTVIYATHINNLFKEIH